MQKKFPLVTFYDQDLIDIYELSWVWIQDYWLQGTANNMFNYRYFNYSDNTELNQFESIMSTFFLVYSNRVYPSYPQLDIFYEKQEEDGAIRCDYSTENGTPVLRPDNPHGVGAPLFSWAEYNLYHKIGNKKRVQEIMPRLESYWGWLERNFKQKNGLYSVPLAATGMINSPRENMHYPIDFNCQMAVNAYYMALMGDILNDKELSFRYNQKYFALKTRINSMMWNDNDGIYYDLAKNEKQIPVKTAASFWSMLAKLMNDSKYERTLQHLNNPQTFGTENPIPTLAADHKAFQETGEGFCGSVMTPYTFMVIKGLEQYDNYRLAREMSIRHLYKILDAMNLRPEDKHTMWSAYRPIGAGAALWEGHPEFPRRQFVTYTGLATIALMIENVIGIMVSLPRKTVRWVAPTIEQMGIQNLLLKRNKITILSNKTARGWEIQLESEKLYYFTIDLLGKKRKTLPIPSGKCSMLVDKI